MRRLRTCRRSLGGNVSNAWAQMLSFFLSFFCVSHKKRKRYTHSLRRKREEEKKRIIMPRCFYECASCNGAFPQNAPYVFETPTTFKRKFYVDYSKLGATIHT